jgi:hypothetical protein
VLRRLLLLAGVVLIAGCGDGDVPDVGDPELIRASRGWPDEQRRRLGLERVNDRQVPGTCKPRFGNDAQRRRVLGRLDRTMHGVLGRDWGGVWQDDCDDGRIKVGIPLGTTAVEVRHVRDVLRRRGFDDITDLVAVPGSWPDIARAQRAFPPVERDGVLVTGQDVSLNAVRVEVARSVDGEGWRRLRATARRADVNIVLVRLDRSEGGFVGRAPRLRVIRHRADAVGGKVLGADRVNVTR